MAAMADRFEEIRRRSEAWWRHNGSCSATMARMPAKDPIRSAARAAGEPLSLAAYQEWRERQTPRAL